MSVLIPEGFVFVPRGAGVAAKLLEAADAVGADQVTSVRSITGGYHVLEEVAKEYGVSFEITDPEATPAESEESSDGDKPAEDEKPADEAKTTRRTAAKK